jgi:two-component system OmpR family sensor kinase
VAAEGIDGRVHIRVADEGPGVPGGDRERIWEAYQRLARDANGPVGGSGIGLALVRELALRHGGDVRVEDVPGGGAAFTIELPTEPLSTQTVDAGAAG